MRDNALIVVVGPTASGKSALALELAKLYKGEIICADSRTVYKGMNIGTAKPTVEEQLHVPHHLLDIVKPDESFNAADFKKRAQIAISDIRNKGKLPILVGGTGLYVDAVIYNYTFSAPADAALREQLMSLSIEELQKRCNNLNIPLPFNSKNKRHLIRVIETGGVFEQAKILPSETLVVGLSTEKNVLKARIASRIEDMFNNGVIDEAMSLAQIYGWDNEAMKSNIYQICKQIVDAHLPLHKARELAVQSDLKLAKRQITWFKRNKNIVWGDAATLKNVVHNFLAGVSYIG